MPSKRKTARVPAAPRKRLSPICWGMSSAGLRGRGVTVGGKGVPVGVRVAVEVSEGVNARVWSIVGAFVGVSDGVGVLVSIWE